MSKVAMAIAAHPDDIEFLMAGTLRRLGEQGFELHYMNLANGCCGSNQIDRETLIGKRLDEAKAAAQALDAVHHPPICDDLGIFYEPHTLARVASIVRQVAPSILLTHAPVDYMEDHTNTCRLSVTAAFSRGMPNFFVEPPCPAILGDVAVYHAQPYSNRDPLGDWVLPNLTVDTTDLQETKRHLLSLHASQKEWLDASQGLDSYLATMSDLDRQVGRWSKRFEYAEGWRQHLSIGLGPQHWNPLADAIGERCEVLRKDSEKPA